MFTFVRVITVSVVMTLTSFLGQALATELVVVSWGGAYTASQQNAYHAPYMKKNPGIKIINDDSAGSAVAKLRAMKQAGNTTWDLVDAVASDAMMLCDAALCYAMACYALICYDAMLCYAMPISNITLESGPFIVAFLILISAF